MSGLEDSIRRARAAASELAAAGTEAKNGALEAMASALESSRAEILRANAADVLRAEESGLPPALVKRLRLDDAKVAEMAEGIRSVARLPDPVGETAYAVRLDDGLTLYQVRCPIGFLGVIFESRPDAVPQIMSLCLKSGNGVAFKGGSEASGSNRILFDVLSRAAEGAGLPGGAFVLMETRADIGEILSMDGLIDLLIPRGSNSFVREIQERTRIPVLGHSSGVCHVYVDGGADLDMALGVALDSKTQYPAACNAAEALLVSREVAAEFVPRVARALRDAGVEIRADAESRAMIPADVPSKEASEGDWGAEYGDLTISLKIVGGADEAIGFINRHGSHHTDAIVTGDPAARDAFVRRVDSADVFVNASTRFADGYRFGKGAEVGISTNKIHSRGPVGMEGLMIYKYVLAGSGHVVKDYSGPGARRFAHEAVDERYGMSP
ncbi:MAG: glutamate-5-semialdehyde dehydrogenase [Candidatus Methanoplasma sp.]|jgi:glutamate-5-semialdehyde dehydrogenase|nr:glutamate-5-semialdehyde dehydrogenase [Candidatus Methanoplasma sp.]